MDDQAEHDFYSNPRNLEIYGPWAYKRVRPGVKQVSYYPPSCGPQTQTVNMGSQPYWMKNPEVNND